MAEEEEVADLTERQQFWLNHLRDWEKAGGPMTSYATAQGLEVQTFYHWKRWLTKKGLLAPLRKRPRFQRVKVADPTPITGFRLHLPNGALLEWSGPQNVDELGVLLKAVGDCHDAPHQ